MLFYLLLFLDVIGPSIGADAPPSQTEGQSPPEERWNASAFSGWQTFFYVLPRLESENELPRTCAQFSERFCFMGNLITEKQKRREPEESDQLSFYHMLHPFYLGINWFSFSERYPE
ncbi:uncharacterized protein LOC142357625, partial [Convolutriloba macropyga]|uniref:uncharacterized protein LOC142357625 n=1 Tax=Convolutriloba macropyga TaxID=536237 RepID=UPI003F528D2E